MDGRSIDKIIRSRERGYIWLERELKIKLGIGTALIAVFFLIICFFGLLQQSRQCLFFIGGAVLVNGICCYLAYLHEYQNYLAIFDYLEAFEMGDYRFRKNDEAFRKGLRRGIHSQLTEQLERIGQAVEVYKSQLESEKENTKAMITNISHQLKTPIAALGISFELLEDSQTTQEEKQEFLERGRQEIQKLNHLMGVLMNLSHLEADMIHLNPKEAGLKATIVRAVNGVYIKAEEKNIEIEVEEFRDIELLHDLRWTAEAISNVLDNAVKYSPENTIIQLRVEPLTSYVFIEIEDEGIGISKSDYQNVFKRFYRGEYPEVEQQEGAGVGLYLARQILERQGGNICIVPTHRRGTRVRMMLPKKYTLDN